MGSGSDSNIVYRFVNSVTSKLNCCVLDYILVTNEMYTLYDCGIS